MISIAAEYLIPEKMIYFPFEKQSINDLFISRRKEVHSAGHSVYRPAKENACLLFFLIFLTPKVKELIALVIKQAINTENLRR